MVILLEKTTPTQYLDPNGKLETMHPPNVNENSAACHQRALDHSGIGHKVRLSDFQGSMRR